MPFVGALAFRKKIHLLFSSISSTLAGEMGMNGLHKAALVSLTLQRLFFLVFGSPGTKMPPVQARAGLYTEHTALSMYSSD